LHTLAELVANVEGLTPCKRVVVEDVLRSKGVEFEIVSEIVDIEIIAVAGSIRDLSRLNKVHGDGRWRKLKGHASVRLRTGRVRRAELHWYEAHGIGKRDFKIKRYLD
jgi:hypothetical protein